MVSGNVRLLKHSGSICLAHVAITANEIALIQSSFQKIAARGDQVSVVFYRRLFEVAPSVEALFAYNLEAQQKKFAQMLALLLDKIDNPEAVTSILQDLGRRHAGYDVKNEHYDTAGEVLIWTFQELLGDDFDDRTRAAWLAIYRTFAFIMKSASVSALPQNQYYKLMLQGALVAQYGAEILPRGGGKTA